MPLQTLPTAGIWTSLQLHYTQTFVLSRTNPPSPPPRPSPDAVASPVRNVDWEERGARIAKDVEAIRAAEDYTSQRDRNWLELEKKLQQARQTATPTQKRPAHPITAYNGTIPRLSSFDHHTPSDQSGARESLFPYSPLPPIAPLGSGHQFYVPPTPLTRREQLLLEVCDWTMKPQRIEDPRANPDWNGSSSNGTSSSSMQSSSSEFASGSDPLTSVGELSSSSLSDTREPTLFRSKDRSRDREQEQSARRSNTSSIQAPPITDTERRHQNDGNDSYIQSIHRDLPLQNPFAAVESPLTHRSNMSSLLGLTPMTAVTRSGVHDSRSTSFDGAPFAVSDSDPSITESSAFSPRTPTVHSSAHRPVQRLSASKTQHLADVSRVRTQLRSEQRLHSIPAGSSGSGSGSSGFTSSGSGGGSSSDRDVSLYSMNSGFLSVTHLSDS